MTGQEARRRRRRVVVFSHDGLVRDVDPDDAGRGRGAADADGRRYVAGVVGVADLEPGVIWVTQAVAAAICRHHEQLRARAVAALVLSGEAYEDAITFTDEVLPRICLYDEHLVCDQRHLAGDRDVIVAVAAQDGRYRIGLGQRWYQVDPQHCDLILDEVTIPAPTASSTLRRTRPPGRRRRR
ncbi:hypothetical protein ABZS66_22715 [Dactylosporangium sp. NPDC005572]|uniref:hypothetical protein n=1 Tax=Dactylosporangium sp. NPDC005572 TaxID=3156889 RepID=UPI0033B9392A